MKKIVMAFVFMGTLPLCAYILPAEWIIKEMAKQCIDVKKPATFKAQLTTATNAYLFDGRFTPGLVAQNIREESSKRPAGKISLVLPSLGLVAELMSCGPRAESKIKDYLKKMGIDLSQVGLTFVGHQPAFVIGEGESQVWINKDTFEPLKETSPNGERSFEKWTLIAPWAKRLPSLITVVKGSEKSELSLSYQDSLYPKESHGSRLP